MEKLMIDFNRPAYTGKEMEYIQDAVQRGMLCGDGEYTKRCSRWMEERFHTAHVMLTTSCTHGLEMAIVVVHYAGVSCEMDKILQIAHKYGLKVVEDAAQGVNAYYKGKALGTIGDFGCYSFHETKNYTMGEGGAILFDKDEYQEKAEILREKGTDRSKFFRGQVDKYRWMDYGSSYLPSELNAAYLYAQLEVCDQIQDKRMEIWNYYHRELEALEKEGKITRPVIPEGCIHNAHMYYLKVRDMEVRTKLIHYLREKGICSVFHYIPLHTAPAGQKFGRFAGEDRYTTKESERLLRLPMFYNLDMKDVEYVTEQLKSFKEY